MSTFAALSNVQDLGTRESLKEIARRVAAASTVDPSVVQLGTLPTHLDANQQRLTGLGTPTELQDLITLDHLRMHVSISAQRLLRLYTVTP